MGDVAILILAAVLRLWRLGQNGFDNEYYAAAVRSMAAGWHAFLYNAFDNCSHLVISASNCFFKSS